MGLLYSMLRDSSQVEIGAKTCVMTLQKDPSNSEDWVPIHRSYLNLASKANVLKRPSCGSLKNISNL